VLRVALVLQAATMWKFGANTLVRFGIAAAMLVASLAAGQAQQPGTNVGTLTCTLDPATKEPFGVERELSCSFEPLVGPKADFVGVVKRLGAEAPGKAKIVLVWSVHAPSMETSLNELEGRYLGDLSAERSHGDTPGLVGGGKSNITLRPLTIDPSIGKNAAISVLELELVAMKA